MGARGMFKRLIFTLLLVLFGFGISAQASAADRWQWVNSNDEVSVYLDTQSITYDYGYNISKSTKPSGATAWTKFVEPGKNKIVLAQEYYSFTNNTRTLFSYAVYINDKYDSSETIPVNLRSADPIIPGSFGEDIKNFLKRRAGLY